jgi:CheY-specific phosphatase CheX
VALVCDSEFAEALAMQASGLSPCDLDPEMVADGVGEFLNVLCGNAASGLAKEGHRVELGPPDYDADLCDGWIVDLAVGTGRAGLVLSTF